MEAKGSKGITVVGFFLILISIYLFITAWSFIVSSVVIEDELFLTILALRQSLFPIDIWNPDMETLRRIIRISAILRLVHSLFLFVVAIGLLKLKNWARILLIGYCALWSLVYLAPTIHVRTIDAQTIIYLLKVIPFLMVYTKIGRAHV